MMMVFSSKRLLFLGLVAFLGLLAFVSASSLEKLQSHGDDRPRPPIFPEQFKATAILTFMRQNTSVNCSIYYDYDAGKMRVDQELGYGQVHSYIGDVEHSLSFIFAIVSGRPFTCYKFHNLAAVPPPDLFKHGEFQGHEIIEGVACQKWYAQIKHSAGGSFGIWLWVTEASQTPLRIVFSSLQFNMKTYRPGHLGDPSIWDTPAACNPKSS